VGDLRRLSCGWLVAACVVLMLGMGCAAAPAYAAGPVWTISSASSPTNFAPGDETGDDTYVLTVADVGGGSAGGAPIEVSDSLPSGLVASAISGEDLGNGQTLSCNLLSLSCSYTGSEIASGDVLRIEIAVKVGSGTASSVVNSATVSGGGAETAANTEDPTTISPTGAGFGIADFAATWSGIQAGASVNLTAGFTFNHVLRAGETVPAADTKEVALNLPPGFVANPEAVPQCSISEVDEDACPASAAVGVAFTSSSSGLGGTPAPYSSLIYNVTPSPGELGALVLFLPTGRVWLDLALRADGDYGLSVAANDLPEVEGLISMTLTLWGVPAAYDGTGADHVLAADAGFGNPSPAQPARFLTSAGTCGAPPDSTLSADSWAAPGVFSEASSATPALTGCNRLPFDPSLMVASDANEADTPSGYELDLHVPQNDDAEGLASADLENAAVTLPEGAGISLSAADGLQACTEAQVGLGSSSSSTCPEASKIGTVEVRASLLAHPLQGAIYLAAPSENPFGSPPAMYVVGEETSAGVRIKLAGQIEANPLTGQITIAFRELPQLPISGLQLHFFGGERSLLSTPSACGVAVSTSELTPWSENAGVASSSAFDINSGMNGTSCSASRPFSPSFHAESTAAGEAGVYKSLALFVSRTDQEQELSSIAIQAPPVVAQMFAGAQPCGEPQAAEGRCTTASEVGTVAAQAGLGIYAPDLYGRIYLTGPYDGSGLGLSIVLPVDPAPFELGSVVLRAGMEIDPGTGRLNITSARLPSFADGARLPLNALLLQFELGEFKINPTGCESLAVTGTITSTQGSSVAVSAEPLGAPSSSCPSVQAPPSETSGVSSVVAPSAATVSLLATRLTTNARGLMTVKLSCTGAGACHGKLTLLGEAKNRDKSRQSKRTTIGTGSFSIPAGATATVKLMLNARGKALFRADHGRLSATLTILNSSAAPTQTHSEGVRLVQKKVREAEK
jgi:hypothetical protein